MGFDDHIEEFGGKPVREYDPERRLQEPAGVAYRLRLDWDAAEAGQTLGGSFLARTPRRPPPPQVIAGREKGLLLKFLVEPGVEAVTGLIFGMWEQPYGVDSSGIVAGLVANRDRLVNLRCLFIGEMLMKENEVSWIRQSDMSSIWAAFTTDGLVVVADPQGGNIYQSVGPQPRHLRTIKAAPTAPLAILPAGRTGRFAVVSQDSTVRMHQLSFGR